MTDFSQLASQRRSMRKFTDEQPTEEQLHQIMRAALMAPSSKGTHSYEFCLVQDKAKLAQLSQCKDRGAEFLAGAPAAIVVMANPETSDVWIEDASVASTVILFQAEDLGLGACWIQVRERQTEEGTPAEEEVRRILSLPENLRVLSIIAVGHKGMERKPQNEERLAWDKVHRA